jgi:hypothetical protein
MITQNRVTKEMVIVGLPMLEFVDKKRLIKSSIKIDNDYNNNGKELILYEGLGRKFLALKNLMIDVTSIDDIRNYVLYKGDHVKRLLGSLKKG